MGGPHIVKEFVSVEQSLLLQGRRLRAVCSFQLTMVGPCSPDLQLSLQSLAFFQEARQPSATDCDRAEEELQHLAADAEAAAMIANVFENAAARDWRVIAGEFVS